MKKFISNIVTINNDIDTVKNVLSDFSTFNMKNLNLLNKEDLLEISDGAIIIKTGGIKIYPSRVNNNIIELKIENSPVKSEGYIELEKVNDSTTKMQLGLKIYPNFLESMFVKDNEIDQSMDELAITISKILSK